MNELTGKQRKHLRGLAHDLKPIVHVGTKGLTPEVLRQLDEALEHHELIKVKFLDFKDAKAELTSKITTELDCAEAGTIGHHVILYRAARDPDRREIHLPARPPTPPAPPTSE